MRVGSYVPRAFIDCITVCACINFIYVCVCARIYCTNVCTSIRYSSFETDLTLPYELWFPEDVGTAELYVMY